jgi:hypothetical protein
MSTTTVHTEQASTTTTGSTARPFAVRVPVTVVAIGAVLVGAVVTTGFELLVRAAGVELVAASNPGATPEAIPEGGFFGGVLFWGFFGVVLAVALARFARRPRSTFRRTTWTLTVVSLFAPMVVDAASIATNLALAASHVVAAAVIIPIVAARLEATNPRR